MPEPGGKLPEMQQMAGAASVRFLLGIQEQPPESVCDWLTLRREGLMCLAADQLLQASAPVPDDVRTTFLQAVAFEMRCGSILKELSQAARQRGFEIITFKGCALAFGLYSRPGQRTFCDIDLTVRPQDWQAMVALLQSLGYRHQESDSQFNRQGLIIDLHHHPLHQLADLIGPTPQWWDSALPLSEHTGETLRLAHEHEFILCLFHGAKHSFSRAAWLVDLAMLSANVDPDRLRLMVEKFRAQRQLAYAAQCLKQWFDIELPSVLKHLIPANLNLAERRFMKLVLRREAPEFLGMLTPLSSAPDAKAALGYLLRALYPRGIPLWLRTRQLLHMILAVVKT